MPLKWQDILSIEVNQFTTEQKEYLEKCLNIIFPEQSDNAAYYHKSQELLGMLQKNSEWKIQFLFEKGKIETQRSEIVCYYNDGKEIRKNITNFFTVDPDAYNEGNYEFLSSKGEWIKTDLIHSLIHEFVHSAYNISDENQTQEISNIYCKLMNRPEQFGYNFRRFKRADGNYENRPVSYFSQELNADVYDDKAGKIINELCEKALKHIETEQHFSEAEQTDIMDLINKDEIRKYINFEGVILNTNMLKLNITTGNYRNPEEVINISKYEITAR